MTQDELLAALPPGRLPPGLTQLGPADLLALVGVGLVIAAVIAGLAAPLMKRRPSRRRLVLATRGLTPEDRALAVARILGHLPDGLADVAYRGVVLSDAEFERSALARRRGRP